MNNWLDYQIIITGVTGWIGSRLVHQLTSQGLAYGTDILGISSKITSLGDDRCSYTFDTVEAACDARPKIIFHFAFITKDKVLGLPEQEYIDRNLALRGAMAQLLIQYPIRSLIYASSGAVYKFLEKTDKLDLYLYGKLKYEDEIFFQSLAMTHGFQYIQPRIFNLSGAHINKTEHYAIANFIQSLISQKTITIKAPHHVVRSYLDIDVLLQLLCACIMQCSDSPLCFDASGEDPIELYALAQQIIENIPLPAVDIEVVDNRVAEDRYVGSPSEMSRLLSQFKITPESMQAQILNTYESLKSSLNQ